MSDPPPPPARFLRRVPWDEAPFAALDFEATGLDIARDAIISFGVVPIRRAQILMGDAVHKLVDPGIPPSPRSVKVHGLRRQDLAGAPSLEEGRLVLRDALAGQFLVAWWAGVEAAFLDKLYGGGVRRFMRRTVDVRALAMAWDRLEGRMAPGRDYRLATTAERYGVPVASPHHALDDALVTAQLFLILAARLSARGYRTVRSLLRETTGLAAPPRRRVGRV